MLHFELEKLLIGIEAACYIKPPDVGLVDVRTFEQVDVFV